MSNVADSSPPVVSRIAVVEKAREYIGTPFAHRGRIKGTALDCVGLLLCVAEDLGLRDKLGRRIRRTDFLNYPEKPGAKIIREQCAGYLTEKSFADIQLADIVVFRLGDNPSHFGIISAVASELAFVHAFPGSSRGCIEQVLSLNWRSRIVGVYGCPNVSSSSAD
jgi:hypothetical protein